LNAKQRADIRRNIEDLNTIADLFNSTLVSLQAAILAADPRAFDIKAPPARIQPIQLDGMPPSKQYEKRFKRPNRTVDVEGGYHGAVAASMRRAIATEASDTLRAKVDVALTTRELVQHCPTVKKRYKTLERQIAGLGNILREMGDRYNIKNVSSNANSRWMYVSKIAVQP